jgi:glutamyl-tRNA synthetase
VKIRTRIAPSPTGDPHVGTAYVALVNYCLAKKHSGEFILRIEDTDQARSTRESERAILDSLHWLGLSWDEGPDVGGPHGPYRQSERSAIYTRCVNELLTNGHAFKCFCTPQRLEEMRVAQRAAGEPSRYDGLCLTYGPEEVARREAAGEPFVVRMKVPNAGICVVEDLRRGKIEFEWKSIDMQVLMKSDGLPTYHLANVVDDHLMEITHVVRGEEWVSSAPKHLLLYRYFGWEPPKLVHLPLLRNPDKSKLSKRKNPTGILFYRAMGYLPQALLNFLGLLSNSVAEGEDEMMSLDRMVERFSLEHIPLGGPVFDLQKLDWLNGRHIRALGDDVFAETFTRWAFGADVPPDAMPPKERRVLTLARERIERLSDTVPLVAFLYTGRLDVQQDDLLHARIDLQTARKALALAQWSLDAAPDFDMTSIEQTLKSVAITLDVKFRDLSRLYYVALTGRPTSIPLFDSMEILGRDIVRERLRSALVTLGWPSKREEEEWRKLPGARVEEPV